MKSNDGIITAELRKNISMTETIPDTSLLQTFLARQKSIDYAVLFGSALKKMHAESDVDILLQGKLSPARRIQLSLQLEKIVGRKVDLVLVNETSCELVLEALKHGKVILINNHQALKDDYLRNFYLYDDTVNLRRLRQARMRKRFT